MHLITSVHILQYVYGRGVAAKCLHILQYVYERGIAARCLHILQYVYGRWMERESGLFPRLTPIQTLLTDSFPGNGNLRRLHDRLCAPLNLFTAFRARTPPTPPGRVPRDCGIPHSSGSSPGSSSGSSHGTSESPELGNSMTALKNLAVTSAGLKVAVTDCVTAPSAGAV